MGQKHITYIVKDIEYFNFNIYAAFIKGRRKFR